MDSKLNQEIKSLFTSSYHNIWLSFKDKHIEKAYRNNAQQFGQNIYYMMSFLMISQLLIKAYQVIFQIQNTYLIIQISLLLVIIPFLMFVIRKKPNLILYFSCLCCLINGPLDIQIQIYQQEQYSNDTTTMIGKTIIQTIVFVQMCNIWSLLIPYWYCKSVALLMTIEILILALSIQQGFRFPGMHIGLIIVVPICYYLIDKQNRFNFFQLYKQSEQLKETHSLIIRNISSSIFVCNTNSENNIQCIFANNNSMKQFNLQEPNQILNISKDIKIKDDQAKTQNLLDFIVDKYKITQIENNLDNSILKRQSSLNILEKELQLECELQMTQKQNQTRHFIARLVDCVWEQKAAIIVILDNISDKILNCRLQELDKYKDNLLATVTHDLKNPLNCMMIYSQQSLVSQDIDEIHLAQDIIIKNAQLLNSLINDILDFSQYKNKKLKLHFSEFKLKIMLEEIIQLFSYQAKVKQISLSYCINNIDNFKEFILYNDKNRIKQILINFISNALKYTLNGSITIIVDGYDQDSTCSVNQQQILKISVQDTGVGIPPDIQQQLFKKYNTFNHYQKTLNQNGIGLGLTICKKLVKLLGPNKKIELQSQLNVGSTFSFYIFSKTLSDKRKNSYSPINLFKPAELEEDQVLYSPDIFSEKAFRSQNLIRQMQFNQFIQVNRQKIFKQKKKVKFLIVDDNPFNIMALKVILNQYQSIQCYTANSGQQAIQIFQQQNNIGDNINVILTDVNMPIMNGYQLIKQIRKLEQEDQIETCLIGIVSADIQLDNQFLSIVNFQLLKPVQQEDLEKLMKDLGIYKRQNQ